LEAGEAGGRGSAATPENFNTNADRCGRSSGLAREALLAKGGNRRFWPIWWRSPGSTVLVCSELKLGIDLFAGKSEITEGCSDLREIGDSSDLPGISDVRLSRRYGSDAAGAAQS
jgi:hypothetical protein